MWASSEWSKRFTKGLAWLAVVGVCIVVFVTVRYILDAYWNIERLKDVQAITVAIRQYSADHGGMYPPGLDEEERQLGSSIANCATVTDQCAVSDSKCLDLTSALTPYLKEIPSDPAKWDHSRTRYTVQVVRGGGLLVNACDYSK